MLVHPWRIEMLGGLAARQENRIVNRFRSHRTGALLAYLALSPDRLHPRDEVADAIWPDTDPESARASLRTAVHSLRRQLEPPSAAEPCVLLSDRNHVGLQRAAITTDVAEFEGLIRSAARAEDGAARTATLIRAVDLYRGPLLPGYYDSWALAERERLELEVVQALHEVVAALETEQDLSRAIQYAWRAVAVDPLVEEAQSALVRLYIAVGRPADALRQYEELERLLRDELRTTPSPETKALVAGLESMAPTTTRAVAKSGPPEAPPPTPAAPAITTPEPAPTVRLPVPLTRFFGRDDEIRRIAELLVAPNTQHPTPNTRLLTLTGPGGSGKTRLAVEAGRYLVEGFPGGVWFVPLGDIVDSRLIAGSLVDTLGLERAGGSDPLPLVVDALRIRTRNGPALLILDNFEHLVGQGAHVVSSLLKAVPHLACLVTSRRRLELEGERAIIVPPLPVPDDSEMPTPELLVRYAGVQLFIDRAQSVAPDFQVTRGNAATVAALCERLEGIPLAIELAAARARVLSPAQMLERLAQRFELLATRRLDKSSRHGSLWAAMDWSYHLLTRDQQRFFAALSVFRGGFDLDAAEAVCAAGRRDRQEPDSPWTIENLTQLRAHSLVLSEDAGSQLRFRLLESVREYADEQLHEPSRTAIWNRHLEYYLLLAEQAEDRLFSAQHQQSIDRLEADHDNLRAALDYVEDEGERMKEKGDGQELHLSSFIPHPSREAGLRLAAALAPFWTLRGYRQEGLRRLGEMVETGAAGSERLRVKALGHMAELAFHVGNYDAAVHIATQCLRAGIGLGRTADIARALHTRALVAWRRKQYDEAQALCEQSLAIYRENDDKLGMATVLNRLGVLAINRLDCATAREYYSQSLALHRELGNVAGIAMLLQNLGDCAGTDGDYDTAETLLAECLPLARQCGNRGLAAVAIGTLGEIAVSRGDFARARTHYEESLAIQREIAEKHNIARTLTLLGHTAFVQQDYAYATACFLESLQIYSEIDSPPDVAHLLQRFALLAAKEDRLDCSARLLAAAETIRSTEHSQLPPAIQERHARDLAALSSALAEPRFAAARAEGRSMSLEQAVAEALQRP